MDGRDCTVKSTQRLSFDARSANCSIPAFVLGATDSVVCMCLCALRACVYVWISRRWLAIVDRSERDRVEVEKEKSDSLLGPKS